MIKEIMLKVTPQVAATETMLRQQVADEMGVAAKRLTQVRVLRRSIDARQRQIWVNLKVRAYVDVTAEDEEFEPVAYRDVTGRPQVVVVGAGPGGLFAALRLIELGLRPVVIERGKNVHERKKDLAAIARTQQVDGESNYCFGEGGAGAYSDGKLFTRSKKRGNTEKVLRVFCQHGASTRILADAHPHIGTDRLPQVIEAMRNTITACGGEVHFETRMTQLIIERSHAAERVVGVVAEQVTHAAAETSSAAALPTDAGQAVGETAGRKVCQREFLGPVILATGHSARDVYRYLFAEQVEMEAKGIAVGVRLEHPASLIDRIQYHNRDGRGQWLPAAEYSLVTQVEGRGVYSFCMCPGGFVIPAATGPGQIVVNGMSPSNRGTQWSNSGMVVELRPEDLKDEDERDTLRVMAFQERMERLCWQQGNMRQTAPAQRMADFVNGRLSSDLPRTSYAPGVIASPLHFWLPDMVARRLREGFRFFGKHNHGFLTNEAVMIGVETRTSSPLRILRDSMTLQHVRLSGLYPCGEGAGYAGGIVSAAIDGERCAEQVCSLQFST